MWHINFDINHNRNFLREQIFILRLIITMSLNGANMQNPWRNQKFCINQVIAWKVSTYVFRKVPTLLYTHRLEQAPDGNNWITKRLIGKYFYKEEKCCTVTSSPRPSRYRWESCQPHWASSVLRVQARYPWCSAHSLRQSSRPSGRGVSDHAS